MISYWIKTDLLTSFKLSKALVVWYLTLQEVTFNASYDGPISIFLWHWAEALADDVFPEYVQSCSMTFPWSVVGRV